MGSSQRLKSLYLTVKALKSHIFHFPHMGLHNLAFTLRKGDSLRVSRSSSPPSFPSPQFSGLCWHLDNLLAKQRQAHQMLTHQISERTRSAPTLGLALGRGGVLSAPAAMVCLVLMAVELVIASTEHNQLMTLPTNRAPAPAGCSSGRSAAPTRGPRAGGPRSPPASTDPTPPPGPCPRCQGARPGEALGTTPPEPPGTHLGPQPGWQAALSRRTRRIHTTRAARPAGGAPGGTRTSRAGPPNSRGLPGAPGRPASPRPQSPAARPAAPQPPAPPRASSRCPSLLRPLRFLPRLRAARRLLYSSQPRPQPSPQSPLPTPCAPQLRAAQ